MNGAENSFFEIGSLVIWILFYDSNPEINAKAIYLVPNTAFKISHNPTVLSLLDLHHTEK
jgi:hypothetical protein